MFVTFGEFEIDCDTDIFSEVPYSLVDLRLYFSADNLYTMAYNIGYLIGTLEWKLCEGHARAFALTYARQLTEAFDLEREIKTTLDDYLE
jgi:hypothetical protein